MRSDFELKPERRKFVEDKVSTWAFSAHDFTDDELLYAALVMLQHALSAPELSQWDMTQGTVCSAMSRLSADFTFADELVVFLLASRTAYNEFVKYHNFRH